MIEFKVTPDGGEEFEVTAGTRDVLVWEKTGRGRSFSQLMDAPTLVDLYAIAHIACRRQQLFEGSLEEFERTCDVSAEEDSEEADPTRPAQ